MVSNDKWIEVNENLTEWRKNRTSSPNLDLYKNIVSIVGLGERIADVGAGQCFLEQCLPDGHDYYPIDPFPLHKSVYKLCAEDLKILTENKFDTSFMLASLDNVKDVDKALAGLLHVTKNNIVILTGIDIEPDKYHTHKITKGMLYNTLGKPLIEKEISTKLYLFEWSLR